MTVSPIIPVSDEFPREIGTGGANGEFLVVVAVFDGLELFESMDTVDDINSFVVESITSTAGMVAIAGSVAETGRPMPANGNIALFVALDDTCSRVVERSGTLCARFMLGSDRVFRERFKSSFAISFIESCELKKSRGSELLLVLEGLLVRDPLLIRPPENCTVSN